MTRTLLLALRLKSLAYLNHIINQYEDLNKKLYYKQRI